MAVTIAPTINGIAMPSWLYERWDSTVTWKEPTIVQNGDGIPVVAGLWSLEFRWGELHDAWWRWWTVDVLAGAYYLTCDIKVWSPDGVRDETLTTYSNVLVLRPTQTVWAGGQFTNAVVRIENIIIATLPTDQWWTVNLSAVNGDDIIITP